MKRLMRFGRIALVLLLSGCQFFQGMESTQSPGGADRLAETTQSEALWPAYLPMVIKIAPTPTMHPVEPPPLGATVTAASIGLRDGPGGEYANLATLPRGAFLRVVGQYDSCEWIKVTSEDGLEGWVKTNKVDLELECAGLPGGTFRPLSGTIVLDRRPPGSTGELTVENGGFVDGLIILVNSNEIPVVAFYVRYGSTYTLDGIPDGIYSIYFSTGQDWDGVEKVFTIPYSYMRFEELIDFVTTATQYRTWELTLQPVVGGTAETTSVGPTGFPEIK